MNIPVTKIVYLQKLRDERTKFRINLKKTLRQFKLLFCDEYAGFRNFFNYKRLETKEQSLG